MSPYSNTIEIINNIIEGTKRNLNEIEKKFIQTFYYHVPYEELTIHNVEHYVSLALNIFEFFNKDVKNLKIRCYYPSISENGYTSSNPVLEMHHVDIPFLVDSITGALTQRGYRINQIIHPIIQTQRNEKGEVVDIALTSKNRPNFQPESLMQFQFFGPANNEQELQDIVSYISKILENVNSAVKDWKEMLETASKISNLKLEDESKEFIEWIKSNSFTFVGMLESEKGKAKQSNALGIAKLNDGNLISEIEKQNKIVLNLDQEIFITKIHHISPVHRNVNLDLISIREKGNNKIYNIIGLFTSAVYYQSASLIPIVRRKIDSALVNSGFQRASHNYKELMSIIEAFPRDELLQINENELFTTAINILTLHERPRVKLFLQPSISKNFVSCIIFIPRERFSNRLCEQIREILTSTYGGMVDRDYLYLNDSRLARYHVILSAIPSSIDSVEQPELEQKIISLTSFWDDDCLQELIDKFGFQEGEGLFKLYQKAFPNSYQENFGIKFVSHDIKVFEDIVQNGKIKFEISHNSLDDTSELKIYSVGEQLPLSTLMPMLDNIGFHTVDSSTFQISRKDFDNNLWVHYFRVTNIHINNENFSEYKERIEDILHLVWDCQLKNDNFNALVINAKISARDVFIIKGLAKYLRQAGIVYPISYIGTILNTHSNIVSKIVEAFQYKFCPERVNYAKFEATISEINNLITNVNGAAEDRILRSYVSIIQAMLRTNFYQSNSDGTYKTYVSFKFNPRYIAFLPLPKPFAEIFVYSIRIEGIHLRGGEVARGGLRLSDRHEDFRTEVLGLMKTQMAKNSIIVPVGSKGGFVVKRQKLGASKQEQMQEAISCYKIFLSGLLDITDNIVNGQITAPKNVVRYDGNDPYLVVAADKGTATFSDIANSISKDYNFWLGDAFASGGSQGYDHKKMGITAKGGFVCVVRHFQEMGIDIFKQEFSVVGIGDMSGDVFGNFMLLSNKIKLIAAFNHMHIFVDPNPDAAKSFEERKRLFNTPGTTWLDYDKSIMSKGAMIFDRKAKKLKLNSDIQTALQITEDEIAPDDLIKHILCAQVDLLWNGGIGTYAKAKEEHPEHVGDKANDAVRINGEDLRCKIVGEGGNLGFTQRGRIEYALKGGRINTDAIDNSAGVDCSDHEVNIKIAFNAIMNEVKVTEQERNLMLEMMTDDVSSLVLADNRDQSLAISIEQNQAHNLFNEHAILIGLLEREGLLDRAVEFLPSNQELELRGANKSGLTRPEMAIILAYSKMSYFNKVLSSSLPDNKYYNYLLLNYFPGKLVEKFSEQLIKHQLRREIISTVLINTIVNRVGISFTHITIDETGCKPEQFAEAFVASCKIFDIDNLWYQIDSLPFNEKLLEQKNTMYKTVQKLLQNSVLWLLKNIPATHSVEDIINDYSEAFAEFRKGFNQDSSSYLANVYNTELQKFLSLNVDKDLAAKIAEMEVLAVSFNIVKFARSAKLKLQEAANIYFNIDEAIEFSWLKESLLNVTTQSYWQRADLKNLIEELDSLHVQMCLNVNNITADDKFDTWVMKNEIAIQRYHDFILQIKKEHNLEKEAISVALSRVKYLFETRM